MTARSLSGSCLCGAVRYTVSGEVQRFYHCHCSRCRKATGSGHATNLMVEGSLSWHSGAELIRRFKPPQAERFANAFCATCGAVACWREPTPEPLGRRLVPDQRRITNLWF